MQSRNYSTCHLVIEVENLAEPYIGLLEKVCVEETSKYQKSQRKKNRITIEGKREIQGRL